MSQTAEPLHAQSIGAIAASRAGASGVFRRYGINFCCQGRTSLRTAARHRGLDLAELEAALDALDPCAPPPVPQDTDALIDHIVTFYHARHRQQIPQLVALSRKVETVHAGHPSVPAGLSEMLELIRRKLEGHMTIEERVLFPALRRRGSGRLGLPIGAICHDHKEHATFVDWLGWLTGDYRLPDGACRSWRALYAGAAELRADLMEHVHLENNVLFPRFETA